MGIFLCEQLPVLEHGVHRMKQLDGDRDQPLA
jgi:hypothetical protein